MGLLGQLGHNNEFFSDILLCEEGVPSNILERLSVSILKKGCDMRACFENKHSIQRYYTLRNLTTLQKTSLRNYGFGLSLHS